jgi:ribonuclease HI
MGPENGASSGVPTLHHLCVWCSGCASGWTTEGYSLISKRAKGLCQNQLWCAMGLYWVPGHAGVRGNEIADGLARCGSA